MDKKELLQELSIKISSGEISRDEVTSCLHSALAVKKLPNFSVTKMLYALGIAVVVVGIVIFASQIWDDIGSIGRIVITLGLGLLFAAIGSVLFKQRRDEILGSIFHFIGGILIPFGALVTLDELRTGLFPEEWALAITFGIIAVFYLLLSLVQKKTVLTVFTLMHVTIFIYLLIDAITIDHIEDLYAYVTMIIGVSYFLIAHAFRGKCEEGLINSLYFFGITGFLVAAFTQVFGSVLWQGIYFFIIFGALLLSVYLRSTLNLVMGTLALIAYISYITGEYFADSLGWPISLVILGFVILGLGYVSFDVNKKYINNN